MINSQNLRMQHLPFQPWKRRSGGRSVHFLPEKRMMKRCHMDTNLVGTPRLETAADVGEISKTLQHLIMGHSLFSIFMVDAHLFPVCRVAPDRRVHGSGVFFDIPVYNRMVF